MDRNKVETDFAAVDWAELIHDCLINILSRLSLEDRRRIAMRVCKAWHMACQDPRLNAALDLECYFDRSKEHPGFWNPVFEQKIDDMLRSVVCWSAGSLAVVRVRHCSDKSLSLVAQRCPNLKVLSVKSSPHVTDAVMAEIASGCPEITELDVSHCYQVSHESLSAVGSRCPKITVLKRNLMNWLDPSSRHEGFVPDDYMNSCPQDGDSEAEAIAKFMPNLIRLELRFSSLTARGLDLISRGCRSLEYIDLSGCANVTGRDISNARSNMKKLVHMEKPNFYIPRSAFHAERYGHWRLYDDRFQTDIFRI
ncbi:f-box family protein [Genlisea aurea]|uniref:F-box family protein n=1 Tax=Genlisea aurea TaxID=192259 RepID=S8DYG8_9LAMI|nr:f-box family protein [Genlisea aurea]